MYQPHTNGSPPSQGGRRAQQRVQQYAGGPPGVGGPSVWRSNTYGVAWVGLRAWASGSAGEGAGMEQNEVDRSGIVYGPSSQVKRESARMMRHRMTDAEAKLWARIRNSRLDGVPFRRQQVIDGFIVDFYCHAAGLVIELDGSIHSGQKDYDVERDRILERRNLRVLRFSNDRVQQDLEGVLSELRAAVAAQRTVADREEP